MPLAHNRDVNGLQSRHPTSKPKFSTDSQPRNCKLGNTNSELNRKSFGKKYLDLKFNGQRYLRQSTHCKMLKTEYLSTETGVGGYSPATV